MANELPFLPESFAAAIVALATTYLLHSTLLLGGTWLIVRIGRLRSEALKERLWKLAAVLPLCTAPLQMVVHVSPPTLELARPATPIQPESRVVDQDSIPADAVSSTSLPENPPADAPRWSEDTVVARPGSAAPKAALVDPIATSAPVAFEAMSEPPPKEMRPPSAAAVNWVAAALLGICCVGLVRLLLQSVLFARCLKGCEPVPEPCVGRMMTEIARRGNVHRGFRVLTSPNFRQPAAFGLFRWTIMLPADLLRTFDRGELYALLAHESAHLVRGDAVWLWVGRVLCSCLPFQPLNFVARRAWRRSAEMLCDEWALHHSADSLALARCLTRVAESNFGSLRLQALWALGSPSHLSERVERLVNGERRTDVWSSRARGRLVAISAAALAILFVCIAPRTTVLAIASKSAATGAGESASPEPSQSAGDQDTGVALLGEELRQLKSEIDEVRDLLKGQRPGNVLANALAEHVAQTASKLQARYQKLARAGRGLAD